MTDDRLSGGFADAPFASARAFRAALTALARPGTIVALEGAAPPAPLSVAAGTLALTLIDGTTPLFLAPSHDTAAVRDWLGFHCGVPLVGAAQAVFAIGTWASLQPVARFAIGTPDFPDRAATLIVEMPALSPPTVRLSGPGIRTESALALPDIAAFVANRAQYPLGFDCYLTAGCDLAGLPRSTLVEAL